VVSKQGVTMSPPRVIIAGGGPVGLFLAADLGWRHVPTLVVERNAAPTEQAKVMQINIGTMELCRRLGIAESVEHWGFAPDYPMHNMFVTSLDGYELSRSWSPPVGQPGSQGVTEFSPQYQIHCPQPWLEPAIERCARSFPSVEMRRQWEFDSFAETTDSVLVTLRDCQNDEKVVVEADYLVGCEGFGGRVVRQLQIPVEERTVDYSVDLEFLTDDLFREHDKGPAIRYVFIGPRGTWGTLVAVDGRTRWRLSIYALDPDDADTVDVHQAIERAIGHPFKYTLLRQGRWRRRVALAASFGRGRVFIAGDEAHCTTPNGGFGMNTGIADAVNLAWKLEAALQGWAGPELLTSYGLERRPVAQITLAESVRNYHRIMGESAYEDIAGSSPEAETTRRQVGDQLAAADRLAHWPIGIHIGYGYWWSPVVSGNPGEIGDFDPHAYRPSNVAGFRAPHTWLPDGRSTLDLFGRDHVLLNIGAEAGAGGELLKAAQAAGIPVTVEHLNPADAGNVYERSLLLVRPDGFIAWSGDDDPADPDSVVNCIRGATVAAAV